MVLSRFGEIEKPRIRPVFPLAKLKLHEKKYRTTNFLCLYVDQIRIELCARLLLYHLDELP